MAINPNFVFQDPRVQAGVIGMAQIAAAEEAARLQRQAQSQQSFTQAQVARDNAAAERARNDAYLTQRERESARQDVTLNKDLELRRIEEENRRSEYDRRAGRTETDREAAIRSKAQFDTLAQLGSNPDDPPTPREWAGHLEIYGAGLSEEQKRQLTTNWKLNRDSLVAAAKSAAGIEAEINRALSDPARANEKSTIIKSALDQYKFLRATPDNSRVLHSVRVPREDAPEIFTPPTRLGPGAAPPFVPPTSKIQTIEDFLPKVVPQPPVRLGPGAAPPPTAQQLTPFVPGYISTDSPISGMPPAPPPQPSMAVPSFFPNTGTGGFTPAPSSAPLEMPPWMYSPIFGNNGLLGPTGIVGRGVLGQNQGIPPAMYRPMFAEGGMFAPQAQQIPPPTFVPPQYLSTDTPPRAMMGLMPFVPPTYPRLSPFNY